MSENTNNEVHWSFWLIGAVGLIFNLAGCMNYVSQMNAENVAAMPDIYRAMVENRPAWGTGAFAIAVFGGSLGCILLLLRKAIAFYVFIVALAATLAAQVPFLDMDGFPAAAWLGWASQLLVGAYLAWYSRRAQSRAWIR